MADGEPYYSLADEGLPERTIPSMKPSLLTSLHVIPADMQIASRKFFSFEPEAMEKQAFYLAELLRWKPSFGSLIGSTRCHFWRLWYWVCTSSLLHNSFGCSRVQVIRALRRSQ